ncbi:uncharacterized protein LOC132061175 [Lycium ferocissimum]|uniref:uncharacterized protein LOC132061175 n=1 Tax=Lycium ferocissimum TaxID=112874 RepID=UPI002814DF28|nr:uncharacterized protein LOC132061175 [Lycium ferocissimum]
MRFVELSENFQYRDVPDDYVELSLFPFSLIGEVREWLTNLPVGSIASWEILSNKFIDRFFSPKQTRELRRRIANLTQRDSESLPHAWERYKGYLRDCTHHMQPKEIIGNYFVERLNHESRALLNASAQGQILNKTYEEMEDLLEMMSEGHHEYHETSRVTTKSIGVLKVDDVAAIRADIGTLTNVMLRVFPQAQQIQPVQHIQQAACVGCGEPHDYNNYPLNPESVYFVGQQNCGSGNRGNYYGTNYNTPFGKQDFHKSNNYQQPQAQPASNLEEMMKQLIAQNQVTQQQNQKIQSEMQKSIQELERQMGRMTLYANVGPPGALPSDTEKNSKECKAVTLRNGRELEEVHINILLVELLQEVPKYAKYIKDVVANKWRWTEFETVALTEECSSRVRSKISPKLKDPGSFTISITIGNIEVGLALCDLGASINLMPTSVFRTLGLGEPRPTIITLQLADRSLAYPDGIIEDVLVKVGPFILPVDFVILDYEADKSVPLMRGENSWLLVDAL